MTNTTSFKKLITGAGAAAILAGGTLSAGDYGKAIIDDKVPIEPWTICDVFDMNTLYESESGFIRGVALHGRYQGQFISQQEEINDTVNNGYHRWQHRRFRLGMEVELANDITFYAEANIAAGVPLTTDYFISDYQDFYLEWEPSDDFTLRVGKQKQHMTLEDTESSKRIQTVERSPIVNEVAGARPWGAVVEFDTGEFDHEVGAWLYGGHLDQPSWLDTGSAAGFSYNVYFPITETITGHFDYVFFDNDNGTRGGDGGTDAPESFGPAYENTFAAGVEVDDGRFGLFTDLIYASGRVGSGSIPDGSDTWGFYILPSYDITDKLQAVFRYAYMAEGREQRTARFSVPPGNRQNVENYNSFYAGFQYFICGENMKLMAGYDYSTGNIVATNDDVKTGSWQFAVRTYF